MRSVIIISHSYQASPSVDFKVIYKGHPDLILFFSNRGMSCRSDFTEVTKKLLPNLLLKPSSISLSRELPAKPATKQPPQPLEGPDTHSQPRSIWPCVVPAGEAAHSPKVLTGFLAGSLLQGRAVGSQKATPHQAGR